MLRWHIACQWNGQGSLNAEAAHHLPVEWTCGAPYPQKCRGRATQRPYVRLRPLAYVTGSRPHGSIGPPPEQGVEACTVWSGHVSAPDPRLALIKAWVFSVPESRDPAVSGPDPTQRGPGPVPGIRFTPAEVLDLTRRSSLYIQGSGTFPWGPDPLLIPWSISSSLATWRTRSHPHGGVRRCLPHD
jgi:hypothetical protein